MYRMSDHSLLSEQCSGKAKMAGEYKATYESKPQAMIFKLYFLCCAYFLLGSMYLIKSIPSHQY